jgi:hypothetical protein
MSDDIPQWCIDRARELAEACNPRKPGYTGYVINPDAPSFRALARLIHKTQPEPVDPLVDAFAGLVPFLPERQMLESHAECMARELRAECSKLGYRIELVREGV